MELKQHVKVLSYIQIGMGILMAIVGLALLVLLGGIGMAAFAAEGDPAAPAVLGAVGLGLALMFAIFAVPSVIAGLGMLKLKPWSRVLAIVLAVLGLFSVPIGTAVGIYTLWVLFQPAVETAFAQQDWGEE